MRTHSELIRLSTFAERFRYLRLGGSVGEETFGFDRYLNQRFYSSAEWKRIRRDVIIRDDGCDLGIADRAIGGRILIHHMNPVTRKDIIRASEILMDPEFLICVSHETHNAIHYGDESLFIEVPPERKLNDTCPWKNH